MFHHPECPRRRAVVAVAVQQHRRIPLDARPPHQRFELRHVGNIAAERVLHVRVQTPSERAGYVADLIRLVQVRVDLRNYDARITQPFRHPCRTHDSSGMRKFLCQGVLRHSAAIRVDYTPTIRVSDGPLTDAVSTTVWKSLYLTLNRHGSSRRFDEQEHMVYDVSVCRNGFGPARADPRNRARQIENKGEEISVIQRFSNCLTTTSSDVCAWPKQLQNPRTDRGKRIETN